MAQVWIDSAMLRRDGLFEEIVRILEFMPAELREIFILSHYECRGPREIASYMHLEPGELRLKLNRANRVFYRSLRNGGASPSP